MKLVELFEGESVVSKGYVAGDDLVCSNHFLERLAERHIPFAAILAAIKGAAMRSKAELEAIPVDSKLVLRDPDKFGIALQKYENVNRSITWILLTASPTLINGRGDPEIRIPKVTIPKPMNSRFAR